jgi:hypothetical protein
MGLTHMEDFHWEPLALPVATEAAQTDDRPKDPVLVKRERKRQRTLAERKPPAAPPAKILLAWIIHVFEDNKSLLC